MNDMITFKDVPLEKMLNKKLTTVTPTTLVLEAANLMKENRIGAVLILDKETLVGIFTERDVVYRVTCEGLDPNQTLISKVMTKNVITMKTTETIEAAILLASTKNIRHLPVVDKANKLVGIIGMKDIMAEILEFTLPL